MTDRCEDCPKYEVIRLLDEKERIHNDLYGLIRQKVSSRTFWVVITLVVGFIGSVSAFQISTVKDVANRHINILDRINHSQNQITDAMERITERVAENDKRLAITEHEVRNLKDCLRDKK